MVSHLPRNTGARMLLLTLVFSSASVSGQQPQTRKATPQAPESCALPLVQMHDVTGSPVYLRLRYVIQALSVAQDSVVDMAAYMKEFDSASTPALALSSLLTGAAQGKDDLHCAAFVIKQYPSNSADDKTIKAILESSFNREADAINDLALRIKEQFRRSAAVSQSGNTQVRDAERMAAMNASQNKAATNILEATSFVLAKSVDLSDLNAKTTPYLAVTCAEYLDLITNNSPVSKAQKSAYQDSAALIQAVLDGHKCRPETQ